jgi:hypothetical protein
MTWKGLVPAKPTAVPPAPGQQPAGGQQPATQQGVGQHFQGLLPMMNNYVQQHQQKAQAAVAQTHQQALADPNTTPEQRQFHLNALQQMGVQPVSMPAAPQGAAPVPPQATAVNLGQTKNAGQVQVLPNPGEWPR